MTRYYLTTAGQPQREKDGAWMFWCWACEQWEIVPLAVHEGRPVSWLRVLWTIWRGRR